MWFLCFQTDTLPVRCVSTWGKKVNQSATLKSHKYVYSSHWLNVTAAGPKREKTLKNVLSAQKSKRKRTSFPGQCVMFPQQTTPEFICDQIETISSIGL